MALASPEGCLSKLEDKTADALASLTEFQTWSNTANAAAAKAKIYGAIVPYVSRNEHGEITRAELERLRPFAKVYIPDGGMILAADASLATTQRGAWTNTVEIWLEQDYTGPVEEAERTFKNDVGKIMLQLFKICHGNASYPSIAALMYSTAIAAVSRDDEHDAGKALACVLTATMGQRT